MSFPLPNHLKQIPNAEYQRLMNKVVNLQNGSVSGSMNQMGMGYGLNYGVQIPLLKQLVQHTQPNNALAFLLWNQSIRESKIMATYLFEPKNLDNMQLASIIKGIHNNELAEQMARNCLWQLPQLNLVVQQLGQWPVWGQYSVILAVPGYVGSKKMGQTEAATLIHEIISQFGASSDIVLNRALQILFQKLYQCFCGNNAIVYQYIKQLSTSNNLTVKSAAQHFLWLNMP
jgi:hypothetical protein